MNGDSAAAVERLEALFRGARLEDLKKPREHFILETKVDTRTCGLHGRHSLQHNGIDNRRGSLGNILHQQQQRRRDGVGPRRESMPALHVASRRRDSLALPPPRKPDVLSHPSAFPSTLRRDSTGMSMGSLKKESLSKSTTHLRRDSTPGLLKREFHTASHASLRRESVSSIPFLRKSSQVSLGSSRKDSLNSLIGAGPRDAWRRVSTDSLDSVRRNSLDAGRRDSTGWEDPIWEEIIKKMGKLEYQKPPQWKAVHVLMESAFPCSNDNQHTYGIAGLFAWGSDNQHTYGIAGLFACSNDKKRTYGISGNDNQHTYEIAGLFAWGSDKKQTDGLQVGTSSILYIPTGRVHARLPRMIGSLSLDLVSARTWHQFAISARFPPDSLHFIDMLVSDENHISSWSLCAK
uniref:Uncharacterized protein n=1 Tax=Timema bartmani TaxID=61472 RepID=A0A7R9HWI5_9NEOP|nr:unnamed protein product [Timema bartmani]